MMPVHDWSNEPPVPYESFHTAWISEIVRYLNREALPAGYRAYGERHLGVLRPDVTTFVEPAVVPASAATPPAPAWKATATVQYAPSPERYAVRVENIDGRPVAFLELVSPSNKAGDAACERFVEHLAVHVADGLHLALVDVFAEPPRRLHEQLFDQLEAPASRPGTPGPPIVVSCRNILDPSKPLPGRLEADLRPFQVGDNLPPTVLWIGSEQAVELDLERLYHETCLSLRFE